MRNVKEQAKFALALLHGDTATPVESEILDKNGNPTGEKEQNIEAVFEIRLLLKKKDVKNSNGEWVRPDIDKPISIAGFFSNIDIAYEKLFDFNREWIGAFVTINPVTTEKYSVAPDKFVYGERGVLSGN